MTIRKPVLFAALALVLSVTRRSLAGESETTFVEAIDGIWTIGVDIRPPFVVPPADDDPQGESTIEFGLSGLSRWSSFSETPAEGLFRNHMYREWFYFRTDVGGFNDREYPLEALTLVNASNIHPTTGTSQDNLISLQFGDPGVDPLGIWVLYELTETAEDGLGASLRESVRLTNFTGASQHVDLFAYTDLDIDNSPAGDVGQLFSANTIRQTSFIGSVVDVRVASGPNPNAFDIQPYDDIESALDDQLVSNLGNHPNIGPDDVTHAFAWGIDLGPDDVETIVLEKVGQFVPLVLPEVGPDGEFVFDDADPATTGLPPTWYDPIVAVGYEYTLEGAENRFAEVYLPAGFLDGQYRIEVLDASHSQFGQVISVSGDGVNAAFDFTAQGDDGASSFRVTGIEPEAFIDPGDVLGFPTGLTFVNSNAVRFSQTPISIPEPGACLLVIAALALAGGKRRRA
jgi:hypothetical protein